MFDIITWNVDPDLINFGILRVRWYGLLFALSFVCGSYYLHWVYDREKQPKEYAERLFIHVILGIVIGARLGHCLFYQPDYYLRHPLEILMIWKGGLASHGAGIGAFLAIYLYHRKTPGQTYMWLMDRMGVITPLGASLIRLGNLMNSEIVGKPTDGTWGFIFPRVDTIPRHPTQLYESGSYFLVFLLLLGLFTKTNLNQKPGFFAGMFLVTLFPVRFFLEDFKRNQVAFEAGLQFNMGQILSIPAILLGIFFIVRSFSVKKTVTSSKK